MDQSELNATAQKWLESLLHPAENEETPPTPEPVPAGSQDLGLVLEKLRQLMKLDEIPKTSLRAGGTHLAILARSLASYLHVALESRDADKVSRNINEQATKWILSMFKLGGKTLTPFYHDDPREGLARVFRMALCQKYDKYIVDGLSALYAKPPRIYICDSGQAMQCLHVCSMLGLPMSSISFVPCNTVFGSTHSMDVVALEKKINDDLTEGRVPVLLVAYAGTPLAGHIENISRLRELCSQHDMWLHVQGHALSSLCLAVEEMEVASAREADSLTLCPGTWFGLLSCPQVTLHKAPVVIETENIPTSSNFPPKDTKVPEKAIAIPQISWNGLQPQGPSRLLPLTLWLSLQYLGSSTLVETVTYCNNLTQHMIMKLDEIIGVKRFDVPNHRSYVVLFKYFGGGEVELREVIRTPSEQQETTQICKIWVWKTWVPGCLETIGYGIHSTSPTAPPTPGSTSEDSQTAGEGGGGTELKEEATGQIEGETPEQPKETQEGGGTPTKQTGGQQIEHQTGTTLPTTKIVVEELPQATANIANMMIAKDLYHLFPKVGVSTLKLPNNGVCFKFDPINSFPEHSTSIEDVDRFVGALKQKVHTLHPTALARCLIESMLKGQPNLRCLEFPSFFAGGFIQYVPTDWSGKTELTLEEVNRLNKLNLELAGVLAQRNPIYTPFQHGNFTCIMIKELPEDSNIHDFISELLEETQKFEEKKKFLDGMSEKIRQGIQTAETDLSKEKEKLQQEEGILRYIPVVGSVLNWLSPPTPTTPEGRSFSLSSGKVEATSSTYKYKLQLDAEVKPAAAEATPTVEKGEPKGEEPKEGEVPAPATPTATPTKEAQKEEGEAETN